MSTANTTYLTYRYCPRCSALVVDSEADHCLICDLEFAGDPPTMVSPELDPSREALMDAPGQHETPKGLQAAGWLAQVAATGLRIVLVLLVLGAVIAVGVTIWNAIF